MNINVTKVWAVERSAQVKGEPAQRAEDTEQSASPPRPLRGLQ